MIMIMMVMVRLNAMGLCRNSYWRVDHLKVSLPFQ